MFLDGEQKCRICQRPAGESCACGPSLTRFFAILGSVHQRHVSSQRNASAPTGIIGSACIDKLVFRLARPVRATAFIQELRRKRVAVQETKLRDKRWYLQLGGLNEGNFVRGHFRSVKLEEFTSRPSAYPSATAYFDRLHQLVGGRALSSAKLTRIDFAVDYPAEFVEFLRCLNVKRKRARVEFLNEGSIRTGLMVGKAPEKVVVYDRTIRSRETVAAPTRLEIQISGKKLPCTDFEGFVRLQENSKFAPFQSVELADVALPDLALVPSELHRERLLEFGVLLREEGYLGARLKLGGQRNFHRGYGRHLRLSPWSEAPDEALRRHLRTFFEGFTLHGEAP